MVTVASLSNDMPIMTTNLLINCTSSISIKVDKSDGINFPDISNQLNTVRKLAD
jgi:hypothetical protein